MNPSVTAEMREVIEALHSRPAVSIIMPFEPKISLQTEATHSLKTAADKVELELIKNYPEETCVQVMQKLRALIKNLKFDQHKKSIAIYVSPLFEKVLYLDIAVEEKIIVDDSFEIRDLVYSKKQLNKYLVLLLSGKQSHIYLGDSSTLVRIETNLPASIYEYVNDAPERVANFSDMVEHKQIIVHKFLYHIDSALDDILNTYHLPVFVLGAEQILGHFKKFTKHGDAVIAYVKGNYDEATFPQLEEILKPQIAAWKEVKQKELLGQLEEAAGNKKLAAGMKDVWSEAMNHKGRLLVVEKNYRYAAQHGANADIIEALAEPYDQFSFIRDAVDDIIEAILQNGGDVEFVDEDVLKDYRHIALIQYY